MHGLIVLLFGLGLVVPRLPQISAFTYFPDGTVKVDDWFLHLMGNYREYIHSHYNATDHYLYLWNITSEMGTYAITRYVSLVGYAIGLTYEYELTRNKKLLSEARLLADRWLETEIDSESWLIYKRGPTHHFFWHDASVWFLWARLNDLLGTHYPVVNRIDTAISWASYDNDTNLAWQYIWKTTAHEWDKLVVNTWMPMMLVMSYATNTDMKNYTDEIKRLYHTTERFRMDDERYKYKMSGTGSDFPYTLIIVFTLLQSRKYLPSVFNDIQIQATIDSFTMNDFAANYAHIVHGADLGLIAHSQGFDVSEVWKRLVRMVYDQTYNTFKENTTLDTYIWDGNVAKLNQMGHLLISLGMSAGTELAVSTPTIQRSGSFYYLSTLIQNNTNLVYSSGSYFKYPAWSNVYGGVKEYPTNIWQNYQWNPTDERFEATYTTYAPPRRTLSLHFDKYGKNFNFTVDSGTVNWYLLREPAISATVRFVFSNKTYVTIPDSNATYNVGGTFAIEYDLASSVSWWVFQMGASTVEVYYDGSWRYFNATVSYLGSWVFSTAGFSVTTDAMRNVVREFIYDSVVARAHPQDLIEKVIATIETWHLPKGTQNSLKAQLKAAIHMLDIGKEDRAIRKLTDFINEIKKLRETKLTNDQADYLMTEARRIIDLIEG